MKRELLIAADPAAAATSVFLAVSPRTVALAGGQTPRPLYERLARVSHPWAETEVFFGDERCVPPGHPDSNFAMAWATLLAQVPARVHRMSGESCDADSYERELEAVFGPGLPAFDLVILGLGADGHVASLFPGDAALDERERRVVRVERPDHPRLTLTLPVLSAARVALFLVTGAEKAGALAALITDGDTPAARVAARRVVVVADAAAAGRAG